MSYVTIKDIAAVLGISKSTVSRALSTDTENVSEKTIAKVQDCAQKMGYRKNVMAVSLRKREAKTIGIIVPEAVTSFYLQFTAAVQRTLQNYGYRIILTLSDENYITERENLEAFEGSRVDGILISSCNYKANMEYYSKFLSHNIPMVFFDRTVSGLDCSSVRSDDYKSAFFLMEHLVYQGYKKILHIAGPKFIRNSEERLKAYYDVLRKHKIEINPDLVLEVGADEKDGQKAMEKVLDLGLNFDAVFSFTELQALGAKKVLQSRAFHIPEDIAIACMSGTKLSTLVHPELTAVEQPLEQMASEAVRLLLNKITDPNSCVEKVVLPANMLIRESTQK